MAGAEMRKVWGTQAPWDGTLATFASADFMRI